MTRKRGPADTHVDNVCPPAGLCARVIIKTCCVQHGLCDVGTETASHAQCPQRHDFGLKCDAGNTHGIVGGGGNGAGNMRSVKGAPALHFIALVLGIIIDLTPINFVPIPRDRLFTDEIIPVRHQLSLYVGMFR